MVIYEPSPLRVVVCVRVPLGVSRREAFFGGGEDTHRREVSFCFLFVFSLIRLRLRLRLRFRLGLGGEEARGFDLGTLRSRLDLRRFNVVHASVRARTANTTAHLDRHGLGESQRKDGLDGESVAAREVGGGRG